MTFITREQCMALDWISGAIGGAYTGAAGYVCPTCPTCPTLSEMLWSSLHEMFVTPAQNLGASTYLGLGITSFVVIGATLWASNREPARDNWPVFNQGHTSDVRQRASSQSQIPHYFPSLARADVSQTSIRDYFSDQQQAGSGHSMLLRSRR